MEMAIAVRGTFQVCVDKDSIVATVTMVPVLYVSSLHIVRL